MSGREQQFVDAMGEVLASWRLPRATGRVYGHLLLRGAASTSEQLRADLGLSSGAVSTAIRELVSWGLARTISQPGSRRLLVEAAGGFEQLLKASHERSRRFIRTLEEGQGLAHDDVAAERLRDVAAFFAAYVAAGDAMLDRRAER